LPEDDDFLLKEGEVAFVAVSVHKFDRHLSAMPSRALDLPKMAFGSLIF